MKTFSKFITEKVTMIASHKAHALYPFVTELNDRDIKKLLLIRSPEDIKTVLYEGKWKDDGENCYGVVINGIKMGWWWQDQYMENYLLKYNEPSVDEKGKRFLRSKFYSVIENEKQRLYDEDQLQFRIDKIEKEIELMDKMKPKTKEHFFDILKEL